MKSKELRDIYDTLLDTGEIFELMPNAVGLWEKDKKEFIDVQENLNMCIDNPDSPELEDFQIREFNDLGLTEEVEEGPFVGEDEEFFFE